jgi:AraC-like DNA-binding protein
MPRSAFQTFSDPDDYASAIRATKAELTITGRGQFSAKLVRIDLHRLWMQRFFDNLPRIMHAADAVGRAIISFRTQSGPGLFWGGVEIETADIVRHGRSQSHYQRSTGFASFGAMSLPLEEADRLGTIAGCDLTPPLEPLRVRPPPSAMARLQRLHAAARFLAEEAPEIIANPEAARGLEQMLIEAMVVCLGSGDVRERSVAHRRRYPIIRRFHAALEKSRGRALYLPELCAAVGVSQRTLRRCCYDQFGISPTRFLLLRRMHMARRALREADAVASSASEIAMQFGFWDLNRFDGVYRFLFGESPSSTLSRPSDYRREPLGGFARILEETA